MDCSHHPQHQRDVLACSCCACFMGGASPWPDAGTHVWVQVC